jgi:hypothetical protein
MIESITQLHLDRAVDQFYDTMTYSAAKAYAREVINAEQLGLITKAEADETIAKLEPYLKGAACQG